MNQTRVFSLGQQKYDERKKIRDNSKSIFSWWSPSIELADISNMENKTNEQKLIDYIVFKLEEQERYLETEKQNQKDEDLKKYNEEIEINRILKEEQKKQDEDLVRMMEETKLTKDKRKQQEKQQAKNANQEHLRKKKEREEFYRKSGMLGAKPTKKSHKK